MNLTKSGLGFLQQAFNSNNNQSFKDLDLKMVPARVTDIVLNDDHPKFEDAGSWNGIGTIYFEKVNSPEENLNNPKAKPFFPQFKNYPLVNEIVLLIYLPDQKRREQDSSKSYYYINTISIWNHPHHNGFANNFKNLEEEPKLELNSNNPTGGKFTEKENIRPLLPYTGDNTFEGRFGNSIRLGSTVAASGLLNKNPWSSEGDEGNPITIIRNGQPTDTGTTGWLPIVEDVNQDPSSIYLTTTQAIPLKAASTNYTGIKEENQPTAPQAYNSPQIILNSGRLMLNSTSDSILLSSEKVISLSAKQDIGISTSGSMAIESGELKLGSSEASEPAVLGDTFLTGLTEVMEGLSAVTNALTTEPSLTVTPNLASTLTLTINKFLEKVNDYKSKNVKIL